MEALSSITVLGILAIYFLILIVSSWYYVRDYDHNKTSFLVANRNTNVLEGSLSIGATWLWAFALIMAPFFAYTQGLPGLFWFMVPNTLAIGLMGVFAVKLLEKYPEGFTFSQFMREKYSSKRVQILYQIQFLLLAVYAATINFTVVGLVFGSSSPIPHWVITGILAIGTLAYCWYGGLKASLFTDKYQMIALLLVTVILIPWVIYAIGGWNIVVAGFGGISGQFTNIFHLDTMLQPGLLIFILLTASALGDQSFYQRIFSMGGKNAENKFNTKKAFFLGAIWFFIVPVGFGLLGFAAASLNIVVVDPKVAYIALLWQYLPTAAFVIFSVAILAALGSTLDSALNSAGSIVANDWMPNATHEQTIFASRITMTIIVILGWILSAFQIDIWIPILIYGVLRVAVVSNTIFAIMTNWLTEQGIFYGILVGCIIGISINGYAVLYGIGPGKLWGTILALIIPVIINIGFSVNIYYKKQING